MILQFHARTFALLQKHPAYAPGADIALTALEKRIHTPLPAALWEWYSMEDALDILNRYSNTDPALPPSQMRLITTHDTPRPRHFLTFRHENQGVCTWAIELDGSDDPPVFVDYDTDFHDPIDCSAPFSTHLYTCVWDWAKVVHRCFIQAQNGPLSEYALTFLRSRFTAGPITYGFPGDTQYRFLRGDECVLVWTRGELADWHLATDTITTLATLIRTLWPLDGLNISLWSHTPVGQALLDHFRQSPPT